MLTSASTLRVAVLLLLGAAASSANGQAGGREVAGYVFGIGGNWGIAPQYAPPLMIGQAIYAGDTIRLQGKPQRDDHIDIGLLDLSVKSIDCSKDPKCDQGNWTAPSLHPPQSLLARAHALYAALFEPRNVSLLFTLSRGENGPGAREAVLAMRSNGPDFAAALETLPDNDYELRLTPVAGGSTRALPCRWHAHQAELARTANIRPALYWLEVFHGGAEQGSRAPVLIVPASKLQQANAEFKEATETAAHWEGTAQPESIHYFLFVALDSIATKMALKSDEN